MTPTLKPMSEKAWQKQVIQLATMLGFRAYHTHLSKWSNPGWPDLVLVRERIIYAELKTDKGKVSAEQAAWLTALAEAGQECYVWRPASFESVRETLMRRGKTE